MKTEGQVSWPLLPVRARIFLSDVARKLHVARSAGGSMRRSVVGLLAAVGTAMSALVAFTHGDHVWELIAAAAAANGLVAYLPLPHPKKTVRSGRHGCQPRRSEGRMMN